MPVHLLYWPTVGSWIISCLLLSALLKRDVTAALSALLNLSKIHDALTISLCTTQPLKDPWRAHYISLHYSTSQSLQIHDALTISLCPSQPLKAFISMTRSLHLSALLRLWKLSNPWRARHICWRTLKLPFVGSHKAFKSMRRSIYLLQN